MNIDFRYPELLMKSFHPKRRYSLDAARAAAAELKRRKRTEAVPLDTLEVFVVRRSDAQPRFGWEIRRFGGIVIDRAAVGFVSPSAARSAGLQALSGVVPAAPDTDARPISRGDRGDGLRVAGKEAP